MRMNQIISESEQLDEVEWGKLGQKTARGLGGLAKGLGAIPGAAVGAGSAFKQGYQAARSAVSGRGSPSDLGVDSSGGYSPGYRGRARPDPVDYDEDYFDKIEQQLDAAKYYDPVAYADLINHLKDIVNDRESELNTRRPAPRTASRSAAPAPTTRSQASPAPAGGAAPAPTNAPASPTSTFARALSTMTPQQVAQIRNALAAKASGQTVSESRVRISEALEFDDIMNMIKQITPQQAQELLDKMPEEPAASPSSTNTAPRTGFKIPPQNIKFNLQGQGMPRPADKTPAGPSGSTEPAPSGGAPQAGQIVMGPDDKPYIWKGAVWAVYNPATGKGGQSAKREIGAQLSQAVASGNAIPYKAPTTATPTAAPAQKTPEPAVDTPEPAASPYGDLTPGQQAYVDAREREGVEPDIIKNALARGAGGGGKRPPINLVDPARTLRSADQASFAAGQQRGADLAAQSKARIAAKSRTGTPTANEGFYSRFLDKNI